MVALLFPALDLGEIAINGAQFVLRVDQADRLGHFVAEDSLRFKEIALGVNKQLLAICSRQLVDKVGQAAANSSCRDQGEADATLRLDAVENRECLFNTH